MLQRRRHVLRHLAGLRLLCLPAMLLALLVLLLLLPTPLLLVLLLLLALLLLPHLMHASHSIAIAISIVCC